MKKLFFLIFILNFACLNNDISTIKFKDEIKKTTITEFQINRGIIKLNNEFHFYSNCSLINKKIIPKWIMDEHSPDASLKKYEFHPQLSDIEVPYDLIKYKNENVFYILKNSDTLQFELKEF